ncbi:MAG: hypothetical protein ACYCV7_11735 [Acidimicrobiales bacterium]
MRIRQVAPDELEFAVGELAMLWPRAAALRASGAGWVNLQPVIRQEDEPPPPGMFAIFGGSTHQVPLATWVPGKRSPGGTTKPTTVGLQHGAGPRVARKLGVLGLPLPDGWKVTQDHPRRGLVAELSTGCNDEEAIDWLVRAGTALCVVPSTGRWRASFYPGRPQAPSTTWPP